MCAVGEISSHIYSHVNVPDEHESSFLTMEKGNAICWGRALDVLKVPLKVSKWTLSKDFVFLY